MRKYSGAAGLVCAAMLGWACGGCGPDLPDYNEPKLADGKSASVEGIGGTYITVIDNTKAPGAAIRSLGGWGGNTINVTPGKHKLTIERSSGTQMVTSSRWGVVYNFEAGHSYQVGPENRFNPFAHVVLKDNTTGRVRSLESM